MLTQSVYVLCSNREICAAISEYILSLRKCAASCAAVYFVPLRNILCDKTA